MNNYSKLTPEIIDQLKTFLGSANVRTDAEALERCASDETEDLSFMPEVAVFPETTRMVSEIMKLAHRLTIPVTPRGGGTGLSGGALAVMGGIVLSTERMNNIIEIDKKNLMAIAEPGVITQVFQEEVEKEGLFYPPDPASRGSCFLGGNLAECAGGPRAVKYGVTKDYVMGLEAVLPNGSVINHGGKLLKNATGYNLTQAIIGSEGTLAVITKIFFKLIPLPRFRLTLLIPFPTLESSARAVPAVMNSGVIPSALEFIEQAAVTAAEKHLERALPFSAAAAQLLVELDGTGEDEIARASEIVCEAAMAQGASDVLLADSSRKQQELWDTRRAIGEAVKAISIYKEEDTVVPRNNLVPLLLGVKKIAEHYGITTICYGHAGDGNLHVNILKMKMSDEEWTGKLDDAITEIFKLTVDLGGTISGEHGIGFSQRKYLPLAFSKSEMALMKRIKNAFDPRGILNPQKIFPEE